MNIQYYLDAYNCLKYIQKSLNTGCVSELGDYAKLFFSGSATLGRMPLSPICCQL